MDIVTLQLLLDQTSKQIQELQGLINMQLEFQQLLVQQLATFRQPAAVDQSSRWSATCNAMPRVPPGFEPHKKQFENLEKWIPIAKNIDRQEELAQAPKFCQAFLNKEAGKQICLVNLSEKLQQNLNSVKNHQNITQAVDCQKPKGRQAKHKYCVNQVSLKEVKKVVTEAIPLESKKQAKSTDSCFFCRKSGHFKKNCKRYKAWLQKKRVQNSRI